MVIISTKAEEVSFQAVSPELISVNLTMVGSVGAATGALFGDDSALRRVFVIFADACDLQEHRDGTRQEGVLGSTSSFAAKVGMAVGGSVLAFALSLAGYRPQNPTASIYMVDLMFWLAPTIICVGQALLMMNFRSAGEIIRMDPVLSQFAQVKAPPMGGAIRGGAVDASVKTPRDSHCRKAIL